ncbi:HLH-domain-containing protein [Aspergillus sclerotiicarbonarius CBS 121057]|uniref:HLH-domain-containing protein n=1 Tax=Aspergillus sclerotiicarbonarius (strain CBS 121057 / IBT 28362) TaxID=1448318 RepID=A0A319FKC9_ASPSB|nr:HLH-domain-containing protein [Aspergillus sclerotiicarbonarius CBS 121057]
MSRTRLPPTPAMSGGFIVKDNASVDASDSFTLPPAAISPSKMESASRRSSTCFPASPASPDLALGIMANSPRQTGVKRPLEDFNLPPPPTRTRKIIQMKPKTQPPPKPTATANKASAKDSSKTPSNNAASTNSKKKQPSATSAAGRKIARKTAHSLIERRRRSKMNEEFATLKDMIPACKGQDMHKLAILQASIDYVNYLEQCILDLKTAGNRHTQVSPRMPPAPPSPTSPEALAEESSLSSSPSVSPELPPTDATTDAMSPLFSPRSRGPTGTVTDFASSITPSPALGPTHPPQNTTLAGHSSWAVSSSSTSPVIQPRYSIASSADVDHEASAALLMLNRDCRGSVGSVHDVPTNSPPRSREHGKPHPQDPQRKIGMSVKDLLIS